MKIVPLKEGGESIPVTMENRREFVQLAAQYRLYSSIKDQLESLLAGFYEIIPKDLVSIVSYLPLVLFQLYDYLLTCLPPFPSSSSTNKSSNSSSPEPPRLTSTNGALQQTTTGTPPLTR